MTTRTITDITVTITEHDDRRVTFVISTGDERLSAERVTIAEAIQAIGEFIFETE